MLAERLKVVGRFSTLFLQSAWEWFRVIETSEIRLARSSLIAFLRLGAFSQLRALQGAENYAPWDTNTEFPNPLPYIKFPISDHKMSLHVPKNSHRINLSLQVFAVLVDMDEPIPADIALIMLEDLSTFSTDLPPALKIFQRKIIEKSPELNSDLALFLVDLFPFDSSPLHVSGRRMRGTTIQLMYHLTRYALSQGSFEDPRTWAPFFSVIARTYDAYPEAGKYLEKFYSQLVEAGFQPLGSPLLFTIRNSI